MTYVLAILGVVAFSVIWGLMSMNDGEHRGGCGGGGSCGGDGDCGREEKERCSRDR
ncbi:MAG: hypothetical protein ACI9MC_002322 [Kiritimatiellia bacterium]|jgi:hypothetical protein